MGIALQGVTKRFGDYVALDSISVHIPAGSLTALLGPSGSGKSTLLRVIAGLERPDAGTIHVDDEDLTAVPTQKREVGFVFQHYAAFKHMTVAENIGFGLSIRKRPKRDIQQRVAELLHLVQLDGFGDRYPSQLSGGQRQRMALARALAIEPRVLLLDEPFGALDARVRQDLRSWLRRLHDDMHVTTVLVTHDQEEAMDVAERIVLMNQGRIVQTGAPRDLYEHPATPFVMNFIGHVNQIGEGFVRPHDVHIFRHPSPERIPATVRRVVYLGFEVRASMQTGDGRSIDAQLTPHEANALDLAEGQAVYLDVTRQHNFVESNEDTPAA